MKEEMRTFGYLCPQCGKTVMGTRSVFALEASNAEVECACGKSALKVEFDGTEYHIYVPCGICGETHEAHCPPERVLVLFDDISLPVGKLRIRKNGSAGGHNGLKSIISCLGSDQFPRVKIGVGAKPHPDYDLADWVLSTVSKTEWPDYQEAMSHAGDAALCIVKNGCEKAAAEYNGKMF